MNLPNAACVVVLSGDVVDFNTGVWPRMGMLELKG